MKKRSKKVSKRKMSNYWFKKGKGDWNWVPLNWKGGFALFILFFVNIFASQYFKFMNLGIDGVLKFLVVFFLSLFIFIMVAKHKTKR